MRLHVTAGLLKGLSSRQSPPVQFSALQGHQLCLIYGEWERFSLVVTLKKGSADSVKR